jgi:hypothetical protein
MNRLFSALAAVFLLAAVSTHADIITVDFQVANAPQYLVGTNTVAFFVLEPPATIPPTSGFTGATYSLFDGSNALVAATPPSPIDSIGNLNIAFGPAFFVDQLALGVEVNNIGSLFPAGSDGSFVIQTLGSTNFSPDDLNVWLVATALNGGPQGQAGGFASVATITSVTDVPGTATREPGTLLLLATGLCALAVFYGVRRQRAARANV